MRLSPHQWKTLRTLAICRTSALGAQAFYCPHCRREHVVAHSCRNRHCPHCQGAAALDWLAQQAQTLLPVPYFHLVFTLPHSLNGLIRQNRTALFKLLFDAATQTLLEFGAQRLDAQLGRRGVAAATAAPGDGASETVPGSEPTAAWESGVGGAHLDSTTVILVDMVTGAVPRPSKYNSQPGET